MSLTSNAFFLFVGACVALYYLFPKRLQWMVLLAFSVGYYLTGGMKASLFLLCSTLLTWSFGLLIYRAKQKDPEKRPFGLLLGGLLLNFGMLAYVKYIPFVAGSLLQLFGKDDPFGILFPLGISFYTFSSSGYLLDIYRSQGKRQVVPEKNFFKYALFESFFPQLMQGPIAKYELLAPQFFKPHSFDLNLFGKGCARICIGLFKKLVIADWAGVFTAAVSGNPEGYVGAVGITLLLYYIELYMNFSGAMDIVLGIGELFGLSLDENFKQPYLSTSLSVFWTRWHITLGRWMKDYVFYPIAFTRPAKAIERWGKKHFGRKYGMNLKLAYGELVVFLLVGIWHGANWLSVAFGLYNGLIIAISSLLEGRYAALKGRLHLTGKEGFYVLFMILRTNLLFCLESVFDLAKDLSGAIHLWGLSLARPSLAPLLEVGPLESSTFTPLGALVLIGLSSALVVFFGVLAEKKWDLRQKVGERPALCAAFCITLLLLVGFLGCTGPTKGFIYAQF